MIFSAIAMVAPINAYLQQKFPIFRRTPRWLDGWLDHPALLRMATKNAVSVDASKHT